MHYRRDCNTQIDVANLHRTHHMSEIHTYIFVRCSLWHGIVDVSQIYQEAFSICVINIIDVKHSGKLY
jgi:hypothetical protein